MVILTNADGIPALWTVAGGERRATILAHSLRECLRQLRRCDVGPGNFTGASAKLGLEAGQKGVWKVTHNSYTPASQA